jgi:hypothetical protein
MENKPEGSFDTREQLEKEIERLKKERSRTPNRANRFSIDSRIKRLRERANALTELTPLAQTG